MGAVKVWDEQKQPVEGGRVGEAVCQVRLKTSLETCVRSQMSCSNGEGHVRGVSATLVSTERQSEL